MPTRVEAIGAKAYPVAVFTHMAERPSANPAKVAAHEPHVRTLSERVRHNGAVAGTARHFDRETVQVWRSVEKVQITNPVTGHMFSGEEHKGVYIDVRG